jgi:hypothetical protein
MTASDFTKLIDLLTDSRLSKTQKALSTTREITETKIKIRVLRGIRKSLIALIAIQIYAILLSIALASTLASASYFLLSGENALESLAFQISGVSFLLLLFPLLMILNQKFLLNRSGIGGSIEKIQSELKTEKTSATDAKEQDLEAKIEELIEKKLKDKKSP